MVQICSKEITPSFENMAPGSHLMQKFSTGQCMQESMERHMCKRQTEKQWKFVYTHCRLFTPLFRPFAVSPPGWFAPWLIHPWAWLILPWLVCSLTWLLLHVGWFTAVVYYNIDAQCSVCCGEQARGLMSQVKWENQPGVNKPGQGGKRARSNGRTSQGVNEPGQGGKWARSNGQTSQGVNEAGQMGEQARGE